MESISVKTGAQTEMLDITDQIQNIIKKQGFENGLITVFVPHTTAAITINENADPSVQRDILNEINKVIPFEDQYQHMEGNAAAHIKASLFGASEYILVEKNQLQLGTWQGVFFCEFDGPRSRKVWIKFSG